MGKTKLISYIFNLRKDVRTAENGHGWPNCLVIGCTACAYFDKQEAETWRYLLKANGYGQVVK